MRDPHVVALIYRLETEEIVSFDSPPPLNLETETFKMHLSESVARFEMVEHFPTREAARENVDSFLKAWEINFALEQGRKIAFRFGSAEIIDRDPPPPGDAITVFPDPVKIKLEVLPPTVTMTRRSYPEPPADFAASPDVVMLFERLERYERGGEPLPAIAYAVLSFMEGRAGGRTKASTLFSVEKKLLRTLGHLSSEDYGASDARKYGSKVTPQSYTKTEKSWIEAAMRKLIQRLGQHDFDPEATLPQLTMNDLPKL